MHTNAARPETDCTTQAPSVLCSHVERPGQLGASVSQRLDLLPLAGIHERWKKGEGGKEVNYWRYMRKDYGR